MLSCTKKLVKMCGSMNLLREKAKIQWLQPLLLNSPANQNMRDFNQNSEEPVNNLNAPIITGTTGTDNVFNRFAGLFL